MLALLLLALAAAPQDAPLATIPDDVEVVTQLVATSVRPTYEPRSSLAWSADGTLVAYVARRGATLHPVVGSTVGEAYDGVSNPVVAGGHVAFVVGKTTSPNTAQSSLLVDGELVGPEDGMGDLGASADGETLAYWTQPGALFGSSGSGTKQTHRLAIARLGKNGKWSVRRGDEWRSDGGVPLVSADGARVVTSALKGSGRVVVATSGRREKELSDEHERVDELAISSDGRSVAWVADGRLFFEGKALAEGLQRLALPAIDARGEHVAYVVADGARATVAIDGKHRPVGAYDHVLALAFDPTGERLAFVANDGGRHSDTIPGHVVGGESFVVVLDLDADTIDAGPRFDDVRDLVWDGERARLAYCARTADAWRLVCGERRSEPYEHVGRASFAADGSSVGFGARAGRELWWKKLALD